MKYNYRLDQISEKKAQGFFASLKSTLASIKKFSTFLRGDTSKLPLAFVVIIIDSVAGIITPYIIAKAVDLYISTGDLVGLRNLLFILGGIYFVTVITGYLQGILMGLISQRTLYRLREAIFNKISELPIAFFNQNKAGDLMSRINNDADKINEFISESLSRFVGVMSIVFGIGIFVFFINVKMAIAMLSMVILIFTMTKALAGWSQRRSKRSLETLGNLNAALQENLSNFKVIAAFGKRQYFKSHLGSASLENRLATAKSEMATKVFEPMYEFGGALSIVLVVTLGIYLISTGEITIGILIAFISYTQKFYDPLRTLAVIFGTVQGALAAWGRITDIFNLKDTLSVFNSHSNNLTNTTFARTSNMSAVSDISPINDSQISDENKNYRLELNNISFSYHENMPVLEDVSLKFEAGKTYALVGPTGGGKSTLVSLMSRLFDPDSGEIYLDGKDIRTYQKSEKAEIVSVILQDPILFTGTVADNLKYGNTDLQNKTIEEIEKVLSQKGLKDVINRFENGLNTKIEQTGGAGLSLGQKQLVSFMRAILRQPKLLILDEATANIDTITEGILDKALETLPNDTTIVIIAHRLNTIRNADEIMFVNGHHVTKAGNLDEAISLIENSKRKS